jgi:hypothetical protein
MYLTRLCLIGWDWPINEKNPSDVQSRSSNRYSEMSMTIGQLQIIHLDCTIGFTYNLIKSRIMSPVNTSILLFDKSALFR